MPTFAPSSPGSHRRLILIDLVDLAICDSGELEWLYLARSAGDYDSQEASLRASHRLSAPNNIVERVRELQCDLAHHRGMWHRTPLPDLFIAEMTATCPRWLSLTSWAELPTILTMANPAAGAHNDHIRRPSICG